MKNPSRWNLLLPLVVASCGGGWASEPIVFVDEAHYNAHVVEGSDTAFAAFVEQNGYRVVRSTRPFRREWLDGGQILVIPIPLAARNRIRGDSASFFNSDSTDWSLPNPSAFTAEETTTVERWVWDGGALLVIFDHMPVAGAVADLAAALGLVVSNGHARDTTEEGPIVFRRDDGSLAAHPITDGRSPSERIDSVATYGGAGFRSRSEVDPLLLFRATVVSFTPDTAHVIRHETPRVSMEGWLQGAVGSHGRGRFAFFGEAGMFFAVIRTFLELTPPEDCGLDCWAAAAKQNPQLLLNVLGWLTG